MMTNFRSYYINLARSQDRDQKMRERFARIGLECVRVPAIEGRALPPELPGVDAGAYGWTHGSKLRPGEIGCYLSHLRAIETFYASGAEFAMICEDDAEFAEDLPRILATLTAADAPRDWDLVKLQSVHRAWTRPLRKLSEERSLATAPTRTAGATAYLINRRAARALLENLLPMLVPYDHAYDRGLALGLRVRVVAPFPVHVPKGAAEAPSTIDAARAKKYKDLRRLTTLWWRAKCETSRFACAVAAGFASAPPNAELPPIDELKGLYIANRELWRQF